MSTSPKYPTTKYIPRPEKVYSPSDFERQDSSNDTNFYSVPRFVTHIDDQAIASLTDYYTTEIFQPLLQQQPQPPSSSSSSSSSTKIRILDFCTSHLTHYPSSLLEAHQERLEVIGLGMNSAELNANPVLTTRILADLNANPSIIASSFSTLQSPPSSAEKLDVATCVVSIDYLIHPIRVLQSLRQVTKEGGSVHLVLSNRCFPTKAVRCWLGADEEERVRMVGDFLWRAGWRDVEGLVLSDGKMEEGREDGGREGWVKALMGMRGRDPLWVVRGRNLGESL